MLIGSCSKNENKTETGQLLEIYDVHGSEATARLTVNGKVLFTTSVYIGKNGLGKEGEGDAKTPTGTLRVLSAFGVKPNPGTKIPYINVTSSIYACDDNCEYYNQIIDKVGIRHPGDGARLEKIVAAKDDIRADRLGRHLGYLVVSDHL